MKRKRRASDLPGFSYDRKAKVARFEYVAPGTGGKVRRRETFEAVADFVEATTRYHAWRKEAAAGLAPARPKTFRDYLESWWSLISARTGARTAEMESTIVRVHLLSFFGDRRLEDINAALLKDFVGIKKRDGWLDRHAVRHDYSPYTLNQMRAVLLRILHDAEDRGELAAFPIKGKAPKKEKTVELEMNPNVRAAFLAAFDDEAGFRRLVASRQKLGKVATSRRFSGGPRTFGGGRRGDSEGTGKFYSRFLRSRVLFVVALETGLSRTDVLGLKWDAVDLRTGWIRLPRQKTKIPSAIPITATCREALAEVREQSVGSPYVFTTDEVLVKPDGTVERFPYCESTLGRYYGFAKKLAGHTRRRRFHDLRHTFGSSMASEGVPLQVISKAMGHKTTRMTERYARTSEAALRAIVEASARLNRPSAVNSFRELRASAAGGAAAPASGRLVALQGEKLERATRVELATSSLGSDPIDAVLPGFVATNCESSVMARTTATPRSPSGASGDVVTRPDLAGMNRPANSVPRRRRGRPGDK